MTRVPLLPNSPSPTDGQTLVYDDDTKRWVPSPAPSGTSTLDQVSDTATRVAMTPAERTKLSGVATGATANASDTQLRDRSTHTGAQAVSTVTGLQAALDARVRTVNGESPDASGNVEVTSAGFPTGAVVADQQEIGIYQITEGQPVPPGIAVGSIILTVEA